MLSDLLDAVGTGAAHPVGQIAGGLTIFGTLWRFFLGPLYDVQTRRATDAERYEAESEIKIGQLRDQVDELLAERRELQDQLNAQKIAHDNELHELRREMRLLADRAEQRDRDLAQLHAELDQLRRLRTGTVDDRRTTDTEGEP